MGKELREQQKASTLECEECGAIVGLVTNRENNHVDVGCPVKRGNEDSYDVPEYCKNLPKE
jgi:hypothetical protein